MGASILRDGLIEPIIVRPQQKGRFQLIAGERRFRAIKHYTVVHRKGHRNLYH
ncbi:ParB N-terminal domain-containing protein [Desulfobacula sp.]|uniref:ParB N-terminal domain-containing protein n=1 Tax=Desulfobacula sp. TaxID=2593537 RepID=UPI0039B864E6